MAKLIKQIPADEIKHYIKKYRACNFSNGKIQLEPLRGFVSLDFNSFESMDRVVFECRKLGGNGHTTFIVGNDTSEHHITSKIKQDLCVFAAHDQEFRIKRAGPSTGFVEISGIKIYGDAVDIPQNIKKYNIKWKDILNCCKKYKGLKIVDNRLFASEGAYIKAAYIEEIDTVPQNMFKIKDNGTVKFVSGCEIVNLKIDESHVHRTKFDIPHINVSSNLYPEQNIPPSIEHVPIYRSTNNAAIAASQGNQEVTLSVYDSTSEDALSKALLNNDVKFSNDKKSITMGYRGKLTIPIKNIVEGKEYLVVIECQKINGNGKLMSYISPSETARASMAFATANKRNISLSIRSSFYPPIDKKYKLVIERPDAATGSVVIHKIMLLQGLNLEEQVSQLTANIIGWKPQQTGVSKFLLTDSDDEIFINLKKFSINANTQGQNDIGFIEDVKGELHIKSVSSFGWFSKVKSLFPNLSLVSSSKDSTLTMGALGALDRAKRIYVEEFKQDQKLSKGDDIILSAAQTIITPSFSNYELLSNRYPEAKVIWCHKPWFYMNPKPIIPLNHDYILVINRSSHTTNIVITARGNNKEMPNLVVIGARGKYPNYVFPTNEYLSYNNLLYFIFNARVIVDLPYINNYKSGILDLVLNNTDIPVITSNWAYVGHDNVKFPTCTKKYKDILLPEVKTIENSISEALHMSKTDKLIKNNQKAKEDIKLLLGC